MPISCPENGINCDCASFGISAELSDNTGCSGSQGQQGPPGANGANGNVTYVWSQPGVGAGNPNGRLSANIGDGFKDDDGQNWTNIDGGTTWA